MFGNCSQIIPSYDQFWPVLSQVVLGSCALSGNEFDLLSIFSSCRFLEKSTFCNINPMWKKLWASVPLSDVLEFPESSSRLDVRFCILIQLFEELVLKIYFASINHETLNCSYTYSEGMKRH